MILFLLDILSRASQVSQLVFSSLFAGWNESSLPMVFGTIQVMELVLVNATAVTV